MTKASFPSDSISFKEISTGHNSAGNGGNGYNSGDIINSPSIDFQPYNKAEGADVHVTTADQVHQKPHSDGGPSADSLSKIGEHGTPSVSADTNAHQSNYLHADLSQVVYAGIGGNGGNDNAAMGGNVQLDQTLENSLHFHVDDFGHLT